MKRMQTLLLVVLPLLCQPLAAQESKLLRWKFREGEKLTLTCTQTIDTKRTVQGRSAQMSMILTSQMDWTVNSVDAKGNAKIAQSFRRLTAKLNAANGSSITFDSGSKIKPTGLAKDVAERLIPLIGKEFTVGMTTRGEITDVKLSEELEEAIEDAAGAKEARADLFSKQGITDLMKQFAIKLPEKAVAKGAKWATKHKTSLPIGKLQLENKFTYQGASVVAGRSVLQIGLASDVKVATPAKRTKLKKFENRGTIQFDEIRGRLAKATSKQSIVATTKLRDAVIEIQMSTVITTELKKRDAKK